MINASIGILLLSLVTQIPFAAKTPVEAVQRVARQVAGSTGSITGINNETFASLPLPGAGVEYVAWAPKQHTDASTIRVEIVVRRYDRVLAQRSFVFARVSTEQMVVPQRIIKKGAVIKPSDLKVAKPEHRNTNESYAARVDQVVGKIATHTLHPNRPIALRHIREEYGVERGDKVMVRTSVGSIRVTMKGEAMENGSVGERILVSNSKSGRVIQARVISDGLCEVEGTL